MPSFIKNSQQQSNGDYEVHNTTTGCTYMPSATNQIELGSHPSCKEAVAEAQRRWPYQKINGCYWCARACHTS